MYIQTHTTNDNFYNNTATDTDTATYTYLIVSIGHFQDEGLYRT